MESLQIARESACRGMTEAELANKIYKAMLDEGARYGTSIYLASDGRSSLAHTPPTTNRLEAGSVVIDIHSSFEGYHADMARTLFLEGSSRYLRSQSVTVKE